MAGLAVTTLVYLLLDLLPTVLILYQNRRVLGTSRLLTRGRAVSAALRGAAAAVYRALTCAGVRFQRVAGGKSALAAKPLRTLNSSVSQEISVSLLDVGGGGDGRGSAAAAAIADACEPPVTPVRGGRSGGASAPAAGAALFSPSVDTATLLMASSAADAVAGAVSAQAGPTDSTPFLSKAPR